MSQSQSRNRGASLLAILVLGSSASAIGAGLWLAIQLIVDPDAIIWLHQFLPQQTQTLVTDPQTMRTLPEIRGLLERMGMIPGDTLDLNTAQQDLLLPVRSKRPGCQVDTERSRSPDCEYISQLRVYRRVATPKYFSTAGTYYQLVSQMSVSYSDEEALLDDQSVDRTSSGQLQLTSIELPSPQPEMQGTGRWIHLTGRLTERDKAIAYGQVLYYNPQKNNLVQMLQWASPAGEPAVWRKVTGDRTLELIVNQTIGFDPKFKIYQIQPSQFRLAPVTLVEIALTPFDLTLKNYQNALILARSGLWTPALEMLQPLTLSPDWSPGAQAQLDLIRIHSQVSQSQANKSWASPSQQVLTQIIDGRWQSALQVFQKPQNQREIARLLKTDSDSLWNRVKAALWVTSTQSDVITWGALIRTAKDGRHGGSAWLKKQQTKLSSNHQQIDKLLAQLDNALWTSSVPHLSRIVASVEPKDELLMNDWLLPTEYDTLKLESTQVWYQLRVAGFHNGQRWLRYPFPEQLADAYSGPRFWHLLGLDLDPKIYLTFWSGARQKTIVATVKAVQLKNGVLRLLAAGQALPDRAQKAAPTPLAFTAKALEWLDPQVITLADLSRSRPQLARDILHQLWKDLQAAGQLTSAMAPPTLSQLLPYEASVNVFPLVLGNLPVQLIDLTGDRQPEIVLTLSSQVLASLNGNPQASPRTLIFDSTATSLLYSEFQGAFSKSLIAIADLADGGTPGLIVDGPNYYSLLRWSPDRQRFE